MKQFLLIPLILVGAVNAINDSVSLCQQLYGAYHSSNLGDISPYGMNEFDMVYVNGNYYNVYCVYYSTPGITYLRIASTVEGIASATAINLIDHGVDAYDVVPSIFYDSTGVYKWHLVTGSAIDVHSSYYRTNDPTGIWEHNNTFSVPVGFGDWTIKKSPLDNKWYLAGERNTDFANGPEQHMFRSDSAAGTYMDIGTIFDKSEVKPWFFGQYDAQIFFYQSRAYAAFTAANNTIVGGFYGYPFWCGMVELDVDFKAIGKPVVIQYPDSSWHQNTMGDWRVTEPVICVVNDTARCFYSVRGNYSDPDGWGYVQFGKKTWSGNVPLGTSMFAPVIIEELTFTTADASMQYNYDLSAILSNDQLLDSVNSSSDLIIYDPDNNTSCTTYTYFNKESLKLFAQWQGPSCVSEKVFYLCYGNNINTNIQSDKLLASLSFNESVVNTINGRSAITETNLTYMDGPSGAAVKLNGINSWIFCDLFGAIANRTQFTIEEVIQINHINNYGIICVFNDVNGYVKMTMYNGDLYFYVADATLRYKKFGTIQDSSRILHIVVSWNAGVTAVYINGSPMTEKLNYGTPLTTVPNIPNASLQIGVPPDQAFIGVYSCFNLYSDVKTEAWALSRKNQIYKPFMIDGVVNAIPTIDSIKNLRKRDALWSVGRINDTLTIYSKGSTFDNNSKVFVGALQNTEWNTVIQSTSDSIRCIVPQGTESKFFRISVQSSYGIMSLLAVNHNYYVKTAWR